MQDKMLTTGEPSITAALAPLVEHGLLDPTMLAGLLTHAKVMLRGPDLNTMTPMYGTSIPDGTFTTGASLAGRIVPGRASRQQRDGGGGTRSCWRCLRRRVGGGDRCRWRYGNGQLPVPDHDADDRRRRGDGVAADMVTGPPLPVEGVTLALYPTAQDAKQARTCWAWEPMRPARRAWPPSISRGRRHQSRQRRWRQHRLREGGGVTGHATSWCPTTTFVESRLPGHRRACMRRPRDVRLVNVAVYFDFWVKSTDAVSAERGGDVLDSTGWHTQVFMGEVTDESMPLMMEDPEDGMEMVNADRCRPTTCEEDDGRHAGQGRWSRTGWTPRPARRAIGNIQRRR